MIEKDLRVIRKEFRDIAGPLPTAEISEESAQRSAEIIVELQAKILAKKTDPIDLLRAELATSQLIERWSQLRQYLTAGSIASVNDLETLQSLFEKFSHGDLPAEDVSHLTIDAYIARPSLGANRAMEVFSKLRTIYPNISPKQAKR